jgi:hypothetical protein
MSTSSSAHLRHPLPLVSSPPPHASVPFPTYACAAVYRPRSRVPLLWALLISDPRRRLHCSVVTSISSHQSILIRGPPLPLRRRPQIHDEPPQSWFGCQAVPRRPVLSAGVVTSGLIHRLPLCRTPQPCSPTLSSWMPHRIRSCLWICSPPRLDHLASPSGHPSPWLDQRLHQLTIHEDTFETRPHEEWRRADRVSN